MDSIVDDGRGRLQRLLGALKSAGVVHGARNKTVAEKTGYTEKSVGNILSGNTQLTPRFLKAVCIAFNINPDWVLSGNKPILASTAGLDVNQVKTTVLMGADELENSLIEKFGTGIVATLKDGVKAQIDTLRLDEVLAVGGYIKTLVDSRTKKI